jgi:hypothetical protein
MSPIASILAFAGVASLAVATPVIQSEKRDQTFSLQQVDSGKVKVRSGPAEVSRTFQKFGKQVPSHVEAALAAQGSVTTTPEDAYDSAYLTPVSVGGTTLNLDIDTGSSDLWVFSDELPSSERTGHAIYKTSSSKVLSGQTWSITYGDGSGAKGNVYADTVVVGMLRRKTFC